MQTFFTVFLPGLIAGIAVGLFIFSMLRVGESLDSDDDKPDN